MTKTEIIDAIKQEIFFVDDSIFQVGYIEGRLKKALRTYTTKSGSRKIKKIDTSEKVIIFSDSDNIYHVVGIYPHYVENNDEKVDILFNWYNQRYQFGYVYSFEEYVLRKNFTDQYNIYTGKISNYNYDNESNTLYINQGIKNFDYLVVEYLPVYKLDNDTDEIKDENVVDWIIEYTAELIKKGIKDQNSIGALYDLPGSKEIFENAEENCENLIEKLKVKTPFLGIQRI